MRSSFVIVPVLALLALGQARAADVQIEVQGQNVQIIPAFGTAGPLLTPDAIEQLKLTAEQKDKFAKIETEYKDQQKAAGDKLRDAFTNKDRKAIQEASAESAKVRTDALAKVEALLSDEQKKTFEQVKQVQIRRPLPGAGGVGGPVLPPAVQDRLKLTDEQKKKIEELQKELEAKILGVLTEEQKKQYEEMKKANTVRPGGVIQLRLQ